MRDLIVTNLSAHIEPKLVQDLLKSYEELVAKQKEGDLEAALTKAGRFVEHVFRIIEYLRTGSAPLEIKSVAKTMQQIENDTSLAESLRILIPRAAYGLIYDLRSKRNAVHVKEIDPTGIDIFLTVAGASWIMAEFLRLYHVADEAGISDAMLTLTRTSLPFIESIGDEVFVSRPVAVRYELLLLLAHAKPAGLSRTELGNTAKCSQPSVTKGLKELMDKRYVHLSSANRYFITSNGERALEEWIVTGE
jgi:hypothetical protein